MKILTFDIEEWFHILDNDSTKTELEWNNYPSRLPKNMDIIFSFLEKHNLTATFFVVGWIAEKYPEIIKRISSLGYEIGSHTHMHQLMYEQSKIEVNEDLKKSIQTIEDVTGIKVTAFRAPGFSIKKNNKWVFDILCDHGITHDCSIFPSSRSHGGMPEYKQSVPSKFLINGETLKEFPINTVNFFKQKYIFSGGGYFRLIPYSLIKRWSISSDYVMTYFHTRDFDPDQPMIDGLNATRKFKSYVGLKGCMKKLEKWVNDFNFIDLRSADKLVDWDKVPLIKL